MNGKYFLWHEEDGIFIQTSAEKRPGVMRVEGRNYSHRVVNRNLTVGDLLAAVAKDETIIELVRAVGAPNGYHRTFDSEYIYYFELGNKQVVGCAVGEFNGEGKIRYMYIADEDEKRELSTLWLAKTTVKMGNRYVAYDPAGRDLNDNFVGLRGSEPDSDQRGIIDMFVTDDKLNILYYIYRRQD